MKLKCNYWAFSCASISWMQCTVLYAAKNLNIFDPPRFLVGPCARYRQSTLFSQPFKNEIKRLVCMHVSTASWNINTATYGRNPICVSSSGRRVWYTGPHLRTSNPGFNPGFTPRICYLKGGVNPGLNLGVGVLRFGLWFAPVECWCCVYLVIQILTDFNHKKNIVLVQYINDYIFTKQIII
jgi:hypothetical protein